MDELFESLDSDGLVEVLLEMERDMTTKQNQVDYVLERARAPRAVRRYEIKKDVLGGYMIYVNPDLLGKDATSVMMTMLQFGDMYASEIETVFLPTWEDDRPLVHFKRYTKPKFKYNSEK